MESGLDFAFLKYINVTPESETPIRSFYLPMFQSCRRVVDLGCGTGTFVALLRESGIDAIGVDYDPLACENMQKRQIPFVQQDVITYLETVEVNSLDGIYSAHLVEHLPYEIVLKLIRLAFRALKPGGLLVLATPSPRALVSHLEMYHMHFGHEAFYHPNLLCFFLEYCGFHRVESGENPRTTPLFSHDVFQGIGPDDPYQSRVHYQRGFLPTKGPLRQISRIVKNILFRFIVQPFLDDFESQANRILSAHQLALQHTGVMDRAFECYAIGYRPDTEKESNATG